MNWPNDPPALTMPLAMPRFSGGMSRVVAAISTDGPAMPAPPAARMPMAKISPTVVVMCGISAVPTATISTPATMALPAPTRSASMPANGWVSPHHNCPKANARLMLARPRPVWVLIVPR